MKKGLLFFWLAAAAGGWALDWELPVVTLKGEMSAGAVEVDEEENELELASYRTTVTLTVRESADPLDLAWVVRWSDKRWPDDEVRNYDYRDVVQEARLAVSKRLKLSGEASVKRMDRLNSDTDWTALRAKLGADLAVLKNTSLEIGIDGRWEIHDLAKDSRQRWTGSAAFTTRFDGWLLAARWRGEFRFPLGTGSDEEQRTLNTASVSLRWDPNR